MKWIFWSLIVFQVQLSCAQTRRDSIRQIVNNIGVGINAKESRDKEIATFADSVDRYDGSELPHFLFNVCLDWQAAFWPDMHTATSVRWMILEKVNNKAALKLILKKHDNRLKLRCDHTADNVYPYLGVPMIKKSFYQLIRMRYRQL